MSAPTKGPHVPARVSNAILSYAQEKAATTWCSVCHSLDPGGPLQKRKVLLRSPLGAATQSESTDFDLRDQWGPGRVALVDRTLNEFSRSGKDGCPWCNLVTRACAALDIRGGEANIWLEAGQNPKITIWGATSEATSFELFTSEGNYLGFSSETSV